MFSDFNKENVRGVAAVLVLGLMLAACTRQDSSAVHQMGADVVVGDLIYNVTQAEWRDQLDTSNGVRLATSKFLLVSVSITNQGRELVHVPLLTLVDKDGRTTLEADKGEGVPSWLGVLRAVEPGKTESGTMLFDVAQGEYKLRVASGGDVEKEATALVQLKYQATLPAPAPVEQLPSPPSKQ